jgi:hypothetical protein
MKIRSEIVMLQFRAQDAECVSKLKSESIQSWAIPRFPPIESPTQPDVSSPFQRMSRQIEK